MVKTYVHILKVERTEFPGRLIPGKQNKRIRSNKNDTGFWPEPLAKTKKMQKDQVCWVGSMYSEG